jgi:hypothetical protein
MHIGMFDIDGVVYAWRNDATEILLHGNNCQTGTDCYVVNVYIWQKCMDRRIWDYGLQSVECMAWLGAELRCYQNRVVEFSTGAAGQYVGFSCGRLWTTAYQPKIREIIENIILQHSTCAKQWPWLWMFYMHLECSNPTALKKIYYRAIKYCGWHKLLYMLPQGPFRYAFTQDEKHNKATTTDTEKELQKLFQGIEDRGFFLRSVDG